MATKKLKKFKTLEECQIELGIKLGLKPSVSKLPKKYRAALIADFNLTIICEAHNKVNNEGKIWEPNFNDTNEPKYSMLPWIKASEEQPSGFGFSDSHYAYSLAGTFCGSRHLLKYSELAIHILDQFPDVCKDHFLLK